jgi:limonene-1,2-epoxide hydrolase
VRCVLLAVVATALVGCGSHSASPENVVRAWSASLDRNDNEAAARLFADGAKVIQNGELTLDTHADAVTWNAGLPCGGVITSVQKHGDQVTATFRLTERPHHRCDALGQPAAALFVVRGGKIVLWHETDIPPDSSVV